MPPADGIIVDMKLMVLVCAAALAAGCNLLSQDSSSPTSPSTATSTFSGTVGVAGASFIAFTTASSGTVSLTLTNLSPAPASGVGLGLGTPNGTSSCTLATFTNSAAASTAAQITATENAGTYCAQVYDPGNLTAATTFSVSISHP